MEAALELPVGVFKSVLVALIALSLGDLMVGERAAMLAYDALDEAGDLPLLSLLSPMVIGLLLEVV